MCAMLDGTQLHFYSTLLHVPCWQITLKNVSMLTYVCFPGIYRYGATGMERGLCMLAQCWQRRKEQA